MNINDDEKISVLINMLNERYKAEHNMRDRSVNFTKWILGLGIALLWILLLKTDLNSFTKFFSSAFIVIYSALSFWFLLEICKGFKNNRNIIIRLENALRLYEKGDYLNNETILPQEYKKPYSKKRVPSHFLSLYGLLLILAVFLICLVWFKPSINEINNQDQVKFYQKSNKEK
jgi:Ca2+/Na+ antiporter